MDLIFVTRKSFFFFVLKEQKLFNNKLCVFLLVGFAECKRSCKQSAKSFSVKCNKKDVGVHEEEEEEEEEDKKNRFIRHALCTKQSCLLIQNLSSPKKKSSSVVRKFDKSN
jgi:hypothetical protein